MVWLYVSVPADSSIAFELDKTMTGVGGGEEGGGGGWKRKWLSDSARIV